MSSRGRVGRGRGAGNQSPAAGAPGGLTGLFGDPAGQSLQFAPIGCFCQLRGRRRRRGGAGWRGISLADATIAFETAAQEARGAQSPGCRRDGQSRPRKRRQPESREFGSPGGSSSAFRRPKSKRELVDEVVEDVHFVGSARATMESIIETFQCSGCGGDLKPEQPSYPRGSASLVFSTHSEGCHVYRLPGRRW